MNLNHASADTSFLKPTSKEQSEDIVVKTPTQNTQGEVVTLPGEATQLSVHENESNK